jgi:hypothetical protein
MRCPGNGRPGREGQSGHTASASTWCPHLIISFPFLTSSAPRYIKRAVVGGRSPHNPNTLETRLNPASPRKGEKAEPAWRAGASLSAPVSSSPRRRRKVRRLALFPIASASFPDACLHWGSPSVRVRPWRGLFSIAVVRCDVMSMDLLESQEKSLACRWGHIDWRRGETGAFCSALARPDFDFGVLRCLVFSRFSLEVVHSSNHMRPMRSDFEIRLSFSGRVLLGVESLDAQRQHSFSLFCRGILIISLCDLSLLPDCW